MNPPNPFVAGIHEMINQAVASEVARQLTALAGDLTGGKPAKAAKAVNGTAAKPAANGHRKGEKRHPADIAATVDALAAYITKNPGQRIELIAKAMSCHTKDLNLPVKKLLAAGVIKAKGRLRATSYWPKGQAKPAAKAKAGKPAKKRKPAKAAAAAEASTEN